MYLFLDHKTKSFAMQEHAAGVTEKYASWDVTDGVRENFVIDRHLHLTNIHVFDGEKTFEEKGKPQSAAALLQIYCLSGEADENFLMAHPPSSHLREKTRTTDD